MESIPEVYDPEEPEYKEEDQPEAEADRWLWLEDAITALIGNSASIAASLHGLLEVARAKRLKGESRAASSSGPVMIPAELVDLQLYREDRRLCRKWPELLPVWKHAYPGVNIVAEVRRAHAWELANPAKVKKDRMRFLANWLAREQDKGRGPVKSPPAAEKPETQKRMEDQQMQDYLAEKWGKGEK